MRRTSLIVCILAGIPCSLNAQQPGAAGLSPDSATRGVVLHPASFDSGRTAITRRDAIQIALTGNPQLEAARQQIAQARARGVQARALPDFGFIAEFSQQTGILHQGSALGKDVGLLATLPFPDRIRLRGKVAEGDVKAAEFAYDQLRQLIASQTAQTYDSLLVALRHQEDFDSARQLATDFLSRTEARFNAGTTARLDVVKAKVDLAQAENQLIAGERQIANARAGLNRLLGRRLSTLVETADSLAIPSDIPALDSLEARALRDRPELQSLDAQRTGARAAIGLAREYWLPDLSLQVTRSTIKGDPAPWATTIGFGLPLLFWQHRSGELAEAHHREFELDATSRDLSAQVGQEVRVAYASATTALRQAAYIRDELLPEAQQAYHIAATSYALGGSSTLEVLDAKRTLLDAQSQYTDALGAANDAIAQLELAVGGRLTEVTSGDSNAR